MKKAFALALIILFTITTGYACEESDVREILENVRPQLEEMSLATAQAAWTQDDIYEGDVIIFSTRVRASVVEKDVDEDGYKTIYYAGTMKQETQIGAEGHEHTYLHLTTISKEKVKELEGDGKFHLVKKGVEVGNVQLSRDLPLAVDKYIEIEPVKVYGTIGWKPSNDSDWEFLAHASVSLGYAHGESTKPGVANTNNFYVGQDWGFTVRHRRFGSIMFDRGVDGESKKYDDADPNSREAWVSAAYAYDFNDRNRVTVIAEKRSFRFGPEYEKSRRYMLVYERRFGKKK